MEVLSNIQAADRTAAAGVPRADVSRSGQLSEAQTFVRILKQASPPAQRQICHMVAAYDAGDKRRIGAWAYHWLAFVAINPRIAFRVSPTLRRIARICVAVFVVGVVLALMTGCTGDSGGASSLRATAQAAGVQIGATQAATDPAPTLAPTQPAQISPTVTPDVQPQSFAADVGGSATSQPVQVIEPTAAVLATTEPAQIGIDESVQPCPAKFWRNGRCNATQAQIEAAASEVQP